MELSRTPLVVAFELRNLGGYHGSEAEQEPAMPPASQEATSLLDRPSSSIPRSCHLKATKNWQIELRLFCVVLSGALMLKRHFGNDEAAN